MATDPRTAAIAAAYTTLRRDTLPSLLALYAPDATFKDPFNDVRGHVAIAAIFRHMHDTVDAPRFEVLQTVTQGDDAFLTWNFHCRRRPSGQPLTLHGATHLRYGPDGRITTHRDYWDAAEELYAKLPVLGVLMRWLQRQARAR